MHLSERFRKCGGPPLGGGAQEILKGAQEVRNYFIH
jgi:hypothetical protein